MSTYKLTNLESNTPKKEQEKLSSALNRLSGVKSSKLSPERKEFSLECSGVSPSFDAINAACTGAGFKMQPQDKAPAKAQGNAQAQAKAQPQSQKHN